MFTARFDIEPIQSVVFKLKTLKIPYAMPRLNLYRVLYLNFSPAKRGALTDIQLNLYRVLYLNKVSNRVFNTKENIEPIQSVVFKLRWYLKEFKIKKN